MELHELIEAVKAAADKGALEALVLAELGLNIDKRKSLETLRAEVLAGLNAADGDPVPQPPVTAQVPAQAPAAIPVSLESLEQLESLELPELPKLAEESESAAPAPNPIPELPELEDEPEPVAPVPKQRLLRHKDNGRLLVWTSALAGLTELEEV
ncbi:hypothetical protein SAMN05216201_10987 [Pseudomonas linyingensis]|uniref:Uncharacterized protein n=1 Tax=Pseudomonas linyingensis TaxID=915471 RepID=A0A1H6ZAQ1_9PSED|nr:hypothetical protein [Pseudomonas linyingensis]SEJ46712.1 hypothetical protein SAMN05216201_10987 [Pseudomonas linyingensis]